MKNSVLYCLVFVLTFSCRHSADNSPSASIQKEGDLLYVNSEWVNWADTVSEKSSDSIAVIRLFNELSKSSDQFSRGIYINPSYNGNAFIEGHRENFDDDPEQEFVFLAGGLSDQSLLLIIDSIKGKYQIAYFTQIYSYDGQPEIKVHTNGSYKLVELISRGGGGAGYKTDVHALYRLVDSKMHKVLEAYEGTDISGTLKMKINSSMQMWDTTFKEDAVLLHYNAKYWICNNYNERSNIEDSWNADQAQICDPSDGVVLLNKEYGLLCRWSEDSLKYLPDYSRGLTVEQKTLFDHVNSDEDYAKRFFNAFRKDIFDQNIEKSVTLKLLNSRFVK